MHVAHVGDLNEVITKGQISDLILVQEALQENLLYRIARDITKQGKKIILIAGPSSSGKNDIFPQTGGPASDHGFKSASDRT